jgi:cyclophilin family peptidyl-prolyl cis-trans isomerase
MTTNYGDIKIALYSDKTPKASALLMAHATRNSS